MSNNNFHE